ncbi:hypothetical protein C8R48DRAFT_671820 [Suillus tomentosus]|nr:hypothetical protein C8R48DRAFT_671820 [Suillus tomentosus]
MSPRMIPQDPEIAFSANNKKFICSACLDICNCSVCSRRRGEEYISMRGGGFAGSRTKSGILLVPDDSRVPDLAMTPEPSKSAPQTMFWAHVYGIEGERVGHAAAKVAAFNIRPGGWLHPGGNGKDGECMRSLSVMNISAGEPPTLEVWHFKLLLVLMSSSDRYGDDRKNLTATIYSLDLPLVPTLTEVQERQTLIYGKMLCKGQRMRDSAGSVQVSK